MTEVPYVDSFDPEEKDGWASPSTSESSTPYLHTDPTLTPPRTRFATSGKPLQRMIYHS
jgi:hypothetical protein